MEMSLCRATKATVKHESHKHGEKSQICLVKDNGNFPSGRIREVLHCQS